VNDAEVDGARTAAPHTQLTIPARFCGPAVSGNGGFTAGTLADLVRDAGEHATVEVTLLSPPPLDRAMPVEHEGTDTWLRLDGDPVARARVSDAELSPVEAVDPEEARAASSRFPGLTSHPFPGCFSCGPDRAPGDGLRIFPGPVGGPIGGAARLPGGSTAEEPVRVAAVWEPDADLAETSDLLDAGVQRVGPGVTWAALDCVGGWAGDLGERLMVLGRMTAQVDAYPVAGEPHVVVGVARGSEGRKTFTASTLYDSDGRIVARAQHVWIAIERGQFE
jgi:hypothetical protein